MDKKKLTADLNKLIQLVDELRDPTIGCSWIRKQTPQSLVHHTLEESYELVEAIENNNASATKDELGDLLYHIILYSKIASESDIFDLSDVAESVLSKHSRRRSDATSRQQLSAEESSNLWEQKKSLERKEKNCKSILDDIATTLPANTRALKLQRRAAQVGFDWPNVEPVFEKIQEEIAEIKEAAANNDKSHLTDEIGDLLFACINLARHFEINPETALRQSNRKFYKRFNYIEETLQAKQKTFEESALDELEALWQESK